MWHVTGILDGMQTTIDTAGRLVIPKQLRDQVGMQAGPVEVTVDGAALRIEPVAGDELVEEDGYLVIPSAGLTITDEMVRALRDADQR
jgi:AbrB family looped-hinge helix DNA binding protein